MRRTRHTAATASARQWLQAMVLVVVVVVLVEEGIEGVAPFRGETQPRGSWTWCLRRVGCVRVRPVEDRRRLGEMTDH